MCDNTPTASLITASFPVGLAYFNLVYDWVKAAVMFGVINTVSRLDHLDPPKPPKCITMLYVFAEMCVQFTQITFGSLYRTNQSIKLLLLSFTVILTEGSTSGCASEINTFISKSYRFFDAFRGSDADSLSTGMCTTTWEEDTRTWWRSWWRRCAPSASPSCGWDPARRCSSGLSSTASASTLSCGPPSCSPWSLLLRLRFAGRGRL